MKGVCSALELVTVCLGQWLTAFLVPAANFLPPLLFGEGREHTPTTVVEWILALPKVSEQTQHKAKRQ